MNPPASTQWMLYSVARKIGLVPTGEDANLDSNKAIEILDLLDDRVREAWESYDFLETTLLEERAFRDDFNCEICYNTGEITWDPVSRQYYKALVPSRGAPLSNPSIWEANATCSPRWIPFWQTNKTRIGTAFEAYTRNPYEENNAIVVPFGQSTRGLEFSRAQNVATVWLQFRIPYPGIGMYPWDIGTTYDLGEPVVQNKDTYLSLVDNNVGNDPSQTPTLWERFRIPYVLVPFAIQATFGDTLVVDGQNAKANDEVSKAYGLLTSEYDKQTLQTGQMQHWTGRTDPVRGPTYWGLNSTAAAQQPITQGG
jgi:hypothetical protein